MLSTTAWVSLHQVPHETDPVISGVLAAAGLGSALLVGLALAALVRRRSTSYLLVTLALGTLLARTVVGGATVAGVLPVDAHHLLEHGLDVVMAALVVAAVYAARTAEPRPSGGRS